jgi:putative endonuclease
MSIDTGHRYEDAACAYLESRDLRCIARKVPYRFGEIDLLICDEDELLIFVDVRAQRGRASLRFGGTVGSIDHHKQARLLLAARTFLLRYRNSPPRCRFDVVAFEDGGMEWLRNAFDASL